MAVLSFSGALLSACGPEEIVTPNLKVMNISGPSSLEVGKKGNLIVKEGETILTEGLTFNSSDTNVVTVNESGEVTALAVGISNITVKKEGYNVATHIVKVVAAPIVLKDMTLSATESLIKVGLTTELTAKEGETLLSGVTYSISEGSEFASIEGSVLTGVKKGIVKVKGVKEGYKEAFISIEVEDAPEVAPSGYLHKLNKASFPKAVQNIGDNGTYVTEDVKEKIGETTFTFKKKGLGFANSNYNTGLATELNAFQVKKEAAALETTANLTLTKVVIEQVTTFEGDVIPFTLQLGDSVATPTLGKLEDTGLENKVTAGTFKIYKQFVTYTFSEGTFEGALTLSGNAKGVGYFTNMYLYGTESIVKKEMSFINENEEILINHDFSLETQSSEETFDKGKVTYTIKSKEDGMDCTIEGNTLHAGKGFGKVEIEATLEGYISVTASFTIRDLYEFDVATTPIKLTINDDKLKTASFKVESAPTGITLSYDEKVISIVLKEGSYVVTALKEGTTDIKINCTDYKEKTIPVTVSFDNSIISTTDGSNMLTSPISSEDFKYAYKVSGILNTSTREDDSFELKTESGVVINVVDASFNKETLKYNTDTKLFEFSKPIGDTLFENKRIVAGAKATMVLVRRDIKETEYSDASKGFVGFFESISDLEPNSIELDIVTELKEGTSADLKYKLIGNTNMDLTYAYTSSDPEIAEIIDNSKVIGHKPGKVNITVKCNEIPTLTNSAELSVIEDTSLLNSIELSIPSVDLSQVKVGDVIDYEITLNPTYYEGEVKLVLGTPDIISVDETTEKITALKVGTTTIKAVATNPSVESKEMTITVIDKPTTPAALESIVLTDKSGLDLTNLNIGDKAGFDFTLNPSDASISSLDYIVSDPNVMAVDKITNEVTMKAVGTSTLTIKSGDIVSNELTYTVKEKEVFFEPTEISSFTATKTTLDIGEVVDTEFTTNPSKDTLSSSVVFTYSSSDEKIVTVDNTTGKVTAVASGKADVTITYKTLSKTISFTVKAATPVAEAKVYSHAFKSGEISKNTSVSTSKLTLSSVEWTMNGGVPFVGWDANKGLQLGSSNYPIKDVSFKTAISQLVLGKTVKVQSVEVNASFAKYGATTLTISANGVASSEVNNKKLSTTATEYKANFNDVSEGDIDIHFLNTSSKGTYIKSITINYTVE